MPGINRLPEKLWTADIVRALVGVPKGYMLFVPDESPKFVRYEWHDVHMGDCYTFATPEKLASDIEHSVAQVHESW
jgi:hypothetical protein